MFALALQFALLALLIVLSAVFSGSETVLFSLSRGQLEEARHHVNPMWRVAVRLMETPKRTLMTILLGNTAVNVLLFATTYVLFKGLAAQFQQPWIEVVAAIATVLLVVVCGEVVPKVVGAALCGRLAPLAAGVIWSASYVLDPLGRLVDVIIVEPTTRLAFGRAGHEAPRVHDITPDELKTLLELNRRRGFISRAEDEFAREVIDLHEMKVRDVMVPRVDIVAFDINREEDELRDLMRASRLTKVAVYDGDIDQIQGMIYAKILFFEPEKPLRELLTPVRFVPEVITCEQLLRHFQESGAQLAIVVDEFGGVEGLVTLEDVIEEIVGDIEDEPERPFESEIEQHGDDEYDISGQMSVHYWAETFGVPKLAERVATVGGLVLALLGRPAQLGDVVHYANLEMRVLGIRGRRIERLRLRLAPREPASRPEGAAS